MGGHVKHAVSGSAPLGARLGHFYRAIGVNILEGYGLTETTAPASVNLAEKSKIGTVGPALPGVSVRTDEHGELQVKGINVFREYWKNPEATAAAFDGEWFKTGDLGSIDEDGYITVTGRIKEIIVTSGGKNVSPAPLEDVVRSCPLVSQVMVVGDAKPFIAALVTIDADALPGWLERAGRPSDTPLSDLVDDADLRQAVGEAVAEANRAVSRAEQIREFRILPVDFSEARGEMTPTMKVKRAVVAEKYADHIAGIYAGRKQPA